MATPLSSTTSQLDEAHIDQEDADLLRYPRTEMGDAERILSLFGLQLRYASGLGFYVWDGRCFKRDTERHAVTHLALRAMRELYGAAGNLEDSKQREDWAKWSLSGEKRSRLNNAVELLPVDGRIIHEPDDFDTSPHLLNCMNGTLDLDEAALRSHDPSHNITRLAPVTFDAEARAPRFNLFMDEVFNNDQELIAYVQRALGYSISGHTSEEVLFVAHGNGANGKSTLMRTISDTLGDYAATARIEVFMTKRSDAIPNEIAALHGPRFLSASEGNSGQRLAEGLVKQLTGNDTISARYLYHEPFTFRPRFKLWLATNHKPAIRGQDHAIWRRIRLIPFNVTIPPESQDPHLDRALAEELPGILNWLLAGYRAWREGGLGTATAIDQATNSYREESDPLLDFLNAYCDTTDPNATTPTKALYEAYTELCHANGDDPLSANIVGRLLTERGHPSAQARLDGNNTKVRQGIRLKTGYSGRT